MDDFTHLTDEEFAVVRAAVVAEIDRREALAEIPQQILNLANTYAAIGGDPANLTLPGGEVPPETDEVPPQEPVGEPVDPEPTDTLAEPEMGASSA